MRFCYPSGDTFVGNDAAKRTLSARFAGAQLPHAILLEGPRGSGKRMLSKLLAAAALCEQEDAPCGVCPACRKVFGDCHPDVTVVGGSEEARSFHLDTVRTLRESAYILPNEGKKRVFVLCNVHAMTEQAQNALLKLLEEPPAHVLFLLTCEQRSALLETVLSRVYPVTVGGVSVSEAVAVLQRRLPDKSAEELTRAATLWGGVIGQALQGLQDGSYQETLSLLPRLAQGVVAVNELELLKATAPLEKNKDAVAAVLSGLKLLFRDGLCAAVGGDGYLGTSPETAAELAAALTQQQLLALVQTVEELQVARQFNINHTLFLTLLCSRLRKAAGR